MSTSTSTSVDQSGKSGGDVSGFGGAGAGALAGGEGFGGGVGAGLLSGGLGLGAGQGVALAGAAGQAGGDVSDNTSIGSININS